MVNTSLSTSVEIKDHNIDHTSIPLQAPGLPQIQIKWLDSGKPVLEGLEEKAINVSLSHDDYVCMCVAGYGLQGCDIAPIIRRTQQEWIALLSSAREPLMQQLLRINDSLDQAGIRIWAAVEAVRKATNALDIDLVITQTKEDCVLFQEVFSGGKFQVLTFPIRLTRGSQRMVALVVQNT
ncbi:hypothetical protein [Fischerella sp. JS2]|uniref:hypothetical protein n=1 Tax=Fischerella sp. JS2 TaxID=2597771 RepID=UPI0028F1397A|nr:hypothetical protein [Fischerella sp. JS2]